MKNSFSGLYLRGFAVAALFLLVFSCQKSVAPMSTVAPATASIAPPADSILSVADSVVVMKSLAQLLSDPSISGSVLAQAKRAASLPGYFGMNCDHTYADTIITMDSARLDTIQFALRVKQGAPTILDTQVNWLTSHSVAHYNNFLQCQGAREFMKIEWTGTSTTRFGNTAGHDTTDGQLFSTFNGRAYPVNKTVDFMGHVNRTATDTIFIGGVSHHFHSSVYIFSVFSIDRRSNELVSGYFQVGGYMTDRFGHTEYVFFLVTLTDGKNMTFKRQGGRDFALQVQY